MIRMRGLAIGVLVLSMTVFGDSLCQDTSEAFSFGYLTRETRYREFIRRGDSLTQEGLDTLASVWGIPITTCALIVKESQIGIPSLLKAYEAKGANHLEQGNHPNVRKAIEDIFSDRNREFVYTPKRR
ncbi:MAG: hypothetical protein KatS3mg038_0672 [Candidatus Kapaibacterium sp.]|nr:MAG: hypothetical protein KatS3mg038_0672 [Candidatus Kapabacteria bacterium]